MTGDIFSGLNQFFKQGVTKWKKGNGTMLSQPICFMTDQSGI
jgi:hypothetical protein